jgi:hypothetical protein
VLHENVSAPPDANASRTQQPKTWANTGDRHYSRGCAHPFLRRTSRLEEARATPNDQSNQSNQGEHTAPRGLQSGLHSPAFTDVRRAHRPLLRPSSERQRTLAYAGAKSWKACWEQPLTSSNLHPPHRPITTYEGPDLDVVGTSVVP